MARSSNHAVFGVGLVLLSLWLLPRPDCDDGCQSVAEHLFKLGASILRAG